MKKLLLTIIAIVVGCAAMEAASLTPAQTKAKGEISNALRKYSTNVTDDGEETLSFRYDETTFHVSVRTLNTQTLYLVLYIGFWLPDEYDSYISNVAAARAADGKPVCPFSDGSSLYFSCEMYVRDTKPFIAVLPEMLAALISSAEKFQEEYDEIAEDYAPSSQVAGISALETNNREYIFPKIAEVQTDKTKLYLTKVTIDPNYTILDMISYNGGTIMNCTMNPNAYILANGRKYNLIKAEGIACSPTYTDYPNWQSGREVSLFFRLFFPPMPKDVKTLDFMESPTDGWQIKCVVLEHGRTYAINDAHIETASHKWDCIAIEIQDHQTILVKTCQPKSEGTYMYSSQNEFIEDADTGRKYYLQNSSIGFEGSPKISYDTDTITFYEVYPALPPSVKRINISSGTQYYVNGLNIR